MFGVRQEWWPCSGYLSSMQNTMMDGVELASLIHAGKASPIELLEDAISRADALNPQLNAIIHRLDQQARERAQQMGAMSVPKEASLWGVPFLTKDLTVMTKGDPYHAGNGPRFWCWGRRPES